MNSKNPEVVFLPSGLRGPLKAGTRLDQAARELGADLQNLCGGQGKCGKCRVRAVSPDVPHGALSPPTAMEIKALPQAERQAGWRLACQTEVYGDATIDLPDESRTGRQVICKAAGSQTAAPDPLVRRRTVQVPPPDLAAPTADWERVAAALAAAGETGALLPDPGMLKDLPATLARTGGRVAAILNDADQCIVVLQDPPPPLAGVALDIGTTSLAAYLCDLETGSVLASTSAINPQVAFGEDVIARIAHAAAATGGRQALQETVIDAVNRLLEDLAAQSGVPPQAMVEMVGVGNTCMHHLFAGIDPAALGRAPFAPAVFQPLDIPARDLGLNLAPGARAHLLPVVSGFVGADTVGAVLATLAETSAQTTLLVDVGTNGEIVLARGERMVCASCATGPALEGATLRHGMRAAAGAVERVWIDPQTLEAHCRVIGDTPDRPVAAAGICGSGIIDAVAQMVVCGIVGANGRISGNSDAAHLIEEDGRRAYVLVPAEKSATGKPIVVDQEDIRAVQMAKGAIHAAVRLLMECLGVERLDRILLGGAFGSLIDAVSAVTIGLVPPLPSGCIQPVGNVAGDGARLALINRQKRRQAVRLAQRMAYIELTVHPRFSREFAMAMYFPHLQDRKLRERFEKMR